MNSEHSTEQMIDTHSLTDKLLPAVRQVMSVQDITAGSRKEGYAARFRGRLVVESEQAYERLDPAFSREQMTLLFQMDGDQHVVLAVPGRIHPKASNPWVNLLMFVLTLLSVVFTGVWTAAGYLASNSDGAQSGGIVLERDLPLGILFAVSMLAILVAHEFGHYLAARYNNTAVSLPYFLPFPGSPFGTLGAFIQLKQPPRNRKVLLDIGLAGPLAGLVVAIPVLLIGLSLSKIGTLPVSPLTASGEGLEGNSLLYLGAKYLVTGEMLPSPVDYGDTNPVFYWIRYILLGQPIPYGGRDVMLHPMAWAGWAGLLVTALNLIPAGQLDGGHMIYVLLGRNVKRLWPIIVIVLLGMGWLIWDGWFIWAAMIFFMGRRVAQPLDEITPLDGKRRWLALLGLILFVLVFIPVPLLGL
jgi:membrane-associated protease RseP (regulator of RpoE activity)